jgi:hypothetical protein
MLGSLDNYQKITALRLNRPLSAFLAVGYNVQYKNHYIAPLSSNGFDETGSDRATDQLDAVEQIAFQTGNIRTKCQIPQRPSSQIS